MSPSVLLVDKQDPIEIARRHPNPPPEVVAERRLAVQQRGRAQAAVGKSAP